MFLDLSVQKTGMSSHFWRTSGIEQRVLFYTFRYWLVVYKKPLGIHCCSLFTLLHHIVDILFCLQLVTLSYLEFL